MLVKLPGAVLGPESNGGVDKLRSERADNAPEHHADDSPPFTLGSAPIMLPGGANLNAEDLVEIMAQLVNQRRHSDDDDDEDDHDHGHGGYHDEEQDQGEGDDDQA